MIRHFKFLLMVIGALFFVACGSSDSSSASSLIEGKTFYGVDSSSSGYYGTISFNNGIFVDKSFDDTDTEYESHTFSYTVSGDKVTIDEGTTEWIITSRSNGITLTETVTSEVVYVYNTLEDARNAN